MFKAKGRPAFREPALGLTSGQAGGQALVGCEAFQLVQAA